ncbi:MAG: DUF4469 domain-containing protein [Treponema sp.]|nr:DUF4469 domain-containing protein [Treponema sp.]
MNLNTLSSEPLTSKTGRLAIALYPNTMTGMDGEKTSYYARVINRSRLRQEDIADDIIASGTNMSKEEIVRMWKLINNAVTCRLADGLSVDTGLGLLRPSITGSFDSANSEFDKKKHTITVQYRPEGQLRELMSSLTPVIAQGNHVLPEITSVQDKSLPPDEADSLSPGGFFSIRGKNIMVLGTAGENESESPVGLYFDNTEEPEKSMRLLPSQIYHNSTTLLEGIIPQLKNGIYKVRVATKYCGKKGRRTVQEHCFAKDFTVSSM